MVVPRCIMFLTVCVFFSFDIVMSLRMVWEVFSPHIYTYN